MEQNKPAKSAQNKATNQRVAKIYKLVNIRKDLLQILDEFAESKGVDRQEALRIVLFKNI